MAALGIGIAVGAFGEGHVATEDQQMRRRAGRQRGQAGVARPPDVFGRIDGDVDFGFIGKQNVRPAVAAQLIGEDGEREPRHPIVGIDRYEIAPARSLEQIAVAPNDVDVVLHPEIAEAAVRSGDFLDRRDDREIARPVVEQQPLEIAMRL